MIHSVKHIQAALLLIGKEPWEMTKQEYIDIYQQGPKVREDYARAWVPIRQPRGKPNSIEIVPLIGSNIARTYRWNDKEGIGRGILRTDDNYKITDLAVQKEFRGQGIAQALLNMARRDGYSGIGSPENTPAGLGAVHRHEVENALKRGLPVPEQVLQDYL